MFGRFLSPDTLAPDPWNPQNLNRYSYASNNPLRYLDPTGQAEIDVESGFWPGGGMPQYDGVSVRSWRMGQDTFFGRDFYTLQTNFSPSSFSRSWMSDGFGGGRFGLDQLVGGRELFGSFDWTSQRGLQPQRPGSGDALFLETMKGYEAYTTGYDLLLGGSLFKTSLAAIRSVVREGAAYLGGILGGGQTTNLYRAVSPAELVDINSRNAFRNLSGQAEAKYFSTTAEGAASYAKQAY